jgi:hypothetical protein
MAACAIRLLEDPALVEYLTLNARKEIDRYNAPAIRDEWVTLYHEIAAKQGTGEWRVSEPPVFSSRIQGSSTSSQKQ